MKQKHSNAVHSERLLALSVLNEIMFDVCSGRMYLLPLGIKLIVVKQSN